MFKIYITVDKGCVADTLHKIADSVAENGEQDMELEEEEFFATIEDWD